MKFYVAVKQVPDTVNVSVDEDGSLVREGVPSILDPYSEYALSKVLGLRGEGDEVVAFTMGPGQAEAALRRCLELGADSAVLLTDPAFAGSDTYATSRVIAAFVQRYACDADLLVFGRQATDGGTGQVPYETAQMLDVQQFAYVEELTIEDGRIEAVQDYGDSVRRCTVPRGSVVSFGAADPNGVLPTLSGVMAAKDSEIAELDRVKLGLGLYSVGLKGSMTRIVRTEEVKTSRRNRKVSIRDPARAAKSLLEQLEMMR